MGDKPEPTTLTIKEKDLCIASLSRTVAELSFELAEWRSGFRKTDNIFPRSASPSGSLDGHCVKVPNSIAKPTEGRL
jgi:hypothetical protein